MTRSEPTTHVPGGTTGPGVLVVHEGVRRLRWHVSAPGRWQLVGLWPEPAAVDRLQARIRCDEPVLIVLPADDPRVDLEEHEIATTLHPFVGVASLGGLTELTVPVLDWMPEPWRSRGLHFADRSRAALAGRPAALRPALVVEEARDHGAVRFAQRSTAAVTDRAIADAAREVFVDRLGPRGPACSTTSLPVRSAS